MNKKETEEICCAMLWLQSVLLTIISNNEFLINCIPSQVPCTTKKMGYRWMISVSFKAYMHVLRVRSISCASFQALRGSVLASQGLSQLQGLSIPQPYHPCPSDTPSILLLPHAHIYHYIHF